MDGEYRELNNQNVEANILFFGQENCPPGFYFKGNNIRKYNIIHYIQRGKGTFSSAGHHTAELKKGDLFILPKGVPCFYQADRKDPWSYFWLGFSGIKITNFIKGSSLADKNYLRNIGETQFYESLAKLFDVAHQRKSLANDLLTESLIYQTFYHLVTEFPTQKSLHPSYSEEQTQLAMQYLQTNYGDDKCTITEVCRQLEFSRSYLYKLIKNDTGLSPQQLLTKIRMEHSKELLNNTDHSIQTISRMVGYTDEFTFSKAFKRYSGLSPKIYRENSK